MTTGVMSLSSSGEWIDVRTINAFLNEAVRVVRYREVPTPAMVPAELASAIANRKRPEVKLTLLAAGSNLSAANIVEASNMIDTSAVQAWLVERRQPMKVDARTLVALADAGVPGSVTDVMVALAYPKQFHFDRGMGGGGDMPLSRADSARIVSSYMWGRTVGCGTYAAYSPFGWGGDPCFEYNRGFSRYWNRYGYDYGYSRYGYGYGYDAGFGYPYYSGYYTQPIVVVRGPQPEHGQAVKGQGYTRGRGDSSPSASRSGYDGGSRTSGSSGSSGSSSSGSSSSGSSSSGSSSSGSGSTGRTAHTRPPKG
jgi:hypothetical protein